mmetsp:Transcript_31057/g.82596  ORF Transcript_31057/g.82596 Transcript_31057/m.82596 type:complete len:215 (-) Transcript_31057:23-667(-)
MPSTRVCANLRKPLVSLLRLALQTEPPPGAFQNCHVCRGRWLQHHATCSLPNPMSKASLPASQQPHVGHRERRWPLASVCRHRPSRLRDLEQGLCSQSSLGRAAGLCSNRKCGATHQTQMLSGWTHTLLQSPLQSFAQVQGDWRHHIPNATLVADLLRRASEHPRPFGCCCSGNANAMWQEMQVPQKVEKRAVNGGTLVSSYRRAPASLAQDTT